MAESVVVRMNNERAISALSREAEEVLQAAVTFGDPLRDQPFVKIDPTDAIVFCNEGDQVCENRPIITPAHLTYMLTAIDPAVEFIVTKL